MNNGHDSVNHPSHYTHYRGFEVIDVAEQLTGPDGKSGFTLGNAFKYIARAGWKNPDSRIEDLEKAKFYIQREIDRLKKPQAEDPVPPPENSLPTCPSCGHMMKKDLNEKDLFFCTNHTPILLIEASEFRTVYCSLCTNKVVKDADDNMPVYCTEKHPPVLMVGRFDRADRPRCPDCGWVLNRVEIVKTNGVEYYCQNGHGKMIVSRWNDPPSVVDLKADNLLNFGPAGEPRCPTCNIDLGVENNPDGSTTYFCEMGHVKRLARIELEEGVDGIVPIPKSSTRQG